MMKIVGDRVYGAQFWSNEFISPTTINQLANLKFFWLSWLMVDHICIIWLILKFPLRNLIHWWYSLLEKLPKIPSQTRVSKVNHLQTLEENLINITCRNQWNSYMMLITILGSSQWLCSLSWGSQTLDVNLRINEDHALPTKS